MENIHPTAIIDDDVDIHPTAKVWGHTIIRRGAAIQADVVIGSSCYIGENAIIGQGTHVQHGAFIPDRSVIGKHVFLGPLCVFTDDKNPRANNALYKHQPPIVGDRASVGAGVTVLPGVTIGEGCVIGAGTVVTKDVHPNVTLIGNPGRPIQETRNRELVMKRIVGLFERMLREWV